MNTNIPLFYHSSSVLFLDDDPGILKGLSTHVDKRFPFMVQENPQRALDYLKLNCVHPRDFSSDILEENPEMDAHVENTMETFDVNFSKLHSNLKLHDRFGKVQVAIVDRNIPAMDGLEFCRLIKEQFQLPIKIILLTGATTHQEAIKAFNSGKIDAFVAKTLPFSQMIAEVNHLVNRLAWEQFQETSQNLAGMLSHKIQYINHPAFAKAFEKAREANGIVEFYLYDSSGSFLMFDREGKASLFLVRSGEDFEVMSQIAQDSDAPESVLKDLEKRQGFPFNEAQRADLSLAGEQWQDAMVPMQKLEDSDVFYSVAPLSDWRVASFEQYVNEIWPKLQKKTSS